MSNPLKDYKILLVDEDKELGNVLRMTLKEMGFTDVHFTRSGKEALELYEYLPFDFLITEWSARDISGIDLINHIRRDPNSHNPTLPAIMLTGRAEQQDVITARNQGFNEYVRGCPR